MHTRKVRGLCSECVVGTAEDLWVVSKILGHSGIQVTANIHGHMATELQHQAADRMDALLAAVDSSSNCPSADRTDSSAC